MKLQIISPERIIFSGEVELITLPGTFGSFSIKSHHAPIISSLERGKIIYRTNGNDVAFDINSGFVEMNNNSITVCIE